jgi:hypothetical protein
MMNITGQFFLLLLLCWFCYTPVVAQESSQVTSDSLYRIRVRQATYKSFMLPGWGQAYNRSYWKIPIVYGLIGLSGAQASTYHKQYIRYRDAYRIRVDGDSLTIDEYAKSQTNALLKSNRDAFRQGRDTYILLTLGAYLLQVVDAAVDAHLSLFTVSDDLSLRWHLVPLRWPGDASGHYGAAGMGMSSRGTGLQVGLIYHF